ncbi:unnamed protein product [marine sediment metagenome]|uniref:Uncharacterized protein n=1 Tax=marine sediment metagenome TaxID=412755 RepID=X1GGR1_9ZZZZ
MYKTGFENMDTSIYWNAAKKYLPTCIKYLFIAESPPAFMGDKPDRYFYFQEIPGADSLFYTIVKAIYNKDFVKNVHLRTDFLKCLKKDGFFLLDAVEYPINKTKKVMGSKFKKYWGKLAFL